MQAVLSNTPREAFPAEAPENMSESNNARRMSENVAGQQAGPSTPAKARVDAEAIARLRELGEPGGPDLANEFIDLYLADGEALLGKIHDSCTAGDAELLKRQAHTLRGSSRNMGAETVAEIAREIEINAESGATAQQAERVRQLRQVFIETAPLLRAHKLPPPGK